MRRSVVTARKGKKRKERQKRTNSGIMWIKRRLEKKQEVGRRRG